MEVSEYHIAAFAVQASMGSKVINGCQVCLMLHLPCYQTEREACQTGCNQASNPIVSLHFQQHA